MLPAAAPVTLPRLAEVRLDGVVIVFTFVLSILTALAFGSIPLFGGTQLAGSLDPAGRRTTASRGRLRARHFLMGGQVALALVLVTSSSLMVLSFSKLRAVDPGFEPRSALTFSIGLPPRDYADRDAAVAAHHAILDRISAVAGVTSVSASTCLPLAGPCFGNGVVVEGRPALVDSSAGTVSFRAVAGGLLETMGTRIRRGRGIQRGDVERREPIAVVDETFASLVFPNEDPIGRRVSWSLPPAAPGQNPNYTWLTIVGIASSTPVRALGEAAVYPQLYVPMSLTGRFDAPPWEYIGPRVATMNYVVRFMAFSQGQLSSIRRAIDGVDANLAMAQVSTLEETLDRASAQMGFTMALVTIAAGIALLLGVVGIYGVISYIVHQRTGEIGVRLALGAEPGRIAGIIVRQGATAAIAGIAVGLVVALAGGRLIESLLYGVSPRDPGVFAFTTIALVFVALLACWVPARRAARLNPVHALREE
jgi:predicted permease